MSDTSFKVQIKKFFSGDYDSISDLLAEELKDEIGDISKHFNEKIRFALKCIDENKLDEITTVLREAAEHLEFLANNCGKEVTKFAVLTEGFSNASILLEIGEDEESIESSRDALVLVLEHVETLIAEMGIYNDEEDSIEENISPAGTTAGSIAIKPSPLGREEDLEEGDVHDAIPGLSNGGVGEELDSVPAADVLEDPDAMPDPDDPANQHETNMNTSAYEEGFTKGRAMWERGVNAKNIASQLAETEYSESPYGYVKRFQEGLIAGCAFQEEVVRDTSPEMFEEDTVEK